VGSWPHTPFPSYIQQPPHTFPSLIKVVLTHHPKTVCLSFMALDLPVWSLVETSATLYEKEPEKYHLLLVEPALDPVEPVLGSSDVLVATSPRFLWLEFSPYRVILTMQTHGKYSYRHYWERGVFGVSRFWLQGEDLTHCDQIQLRNYTRSFGMKGHPLPQYLRVEYELWANSVNLGHYLLHLEID